MLTDPKNPATNVLYNEVAMAILEDACTRLRALGLHCGLGPDATFPESGMSAVLRVSTAEESLDECIAASLLAGYYLQTTQGKKEFNDLLAQFRADCAIGKAMNAGPTAAGDNT